MIFFLLTLFLALLLYMYNYESMEIIYEIRQKKESRNETLMFVWNKFCFYVLSFSLW